MAHLSFTPNLARHVPCPDADIPAAAAAQLFDWYVPSVRDDSRYPVDGKVVISHTFNAVKSFDVLREGLPQRHAYDLVYSHGLDIDNTGEILAFGSTTGNLWNQ